MVEKSFQFSLLRFIINHIDLHACHKRIFQFSLLRFPEDPSPKAYGKPLSILFIEIRGDTLGLVARDPWVRAFNSLYWDSLAPSPCRSRPIVNLSILFIEIRNCNRGRVEITKAPLSILFIEIPIYLFQSFKGCILAFNSLYWDSGPMLDYIQDKRIILSILFIEIHVLPQLYRIQRWKHTFNSLYWDSRCITTCSLSSRIFFQFSLLRFLIISYVFLQRHAAFNFLYWDSGGSVIMASKALSGTFNSLYWDSCSCNRWIEAGESLSILFIEILSCLRRGRRTGLRMLSILFIEILENREAGWGWEGKHFQFSLLRFHQRRVWRRHVSNLLFQFSLLRF